MLKNGLGKRNKNGKKKKNVISKFRKRRAI